MGAVNLSESEIWDMILPVVAAASPTQRLRRIGYRLTLQRMMIVAAIESSGHHISAEEIYNQIKARYPHLNISTIYRTLDLLKRVALVTETDLGERRVCYHSAERGHHHLVCQRCGQITDLDEVLFFSLKDALRREYKSEADLSHLAIFGCCVCRKG